MNDLDTAWFRLHGRRQFRLRQATTEESLAFHGDDLRGQSRNKWRLNMIVSREGQTMTLMTSEQDTLADDDNTLRDYMAQRRR